MEEIVGKYAVRCAKTHGMGFDVVGYVDTPQRLYEKQCELWSVTQSYASGGGYRFQNMLDMQWGFLQEAKLLAFPEEVVQTSEAPKCSADGTGGIASGLAIGGSFLKKEY